MIQIHIITINELIAVSSTDQCVMKTKLSGQHEAQCSLATALSSSHQQHWTKLTTMRPTTAHRQTNWDQCSDVVKPVEYHVTVHTARLKLLWTCSRTSGLMMSRLNYQTRCWWYMWLLTETMPCNSQLTPVYTTLCLVKWRQDSTTKHAIDDICDC